MSNNHLNPMEETMDQLTYVAAVVVLCGILIVFDLLYITPRNRNR